MRSKLALALAAAGLLLARPCGAASVFTVTNTQDSGAGSLRQAILDANGAAGADTIQFAVGTGPQTITLGSVLPSIDEAVTIDATTQPGWAGAPLIDVDGNGKSGAGLVITAGPTTVKGLVLRNFHGIGIRIQSAGNTIQGCFIGTSADGTGASPNTNGGVSIESGSGTNLIGGASSGNVISGNGAPGVAICATCTGNTIAGNLIGTNAAGTAAVPNTVGIQVSGSTTTIGGAAAGAGNVVSGNTGAGIAIQGSATGVLVLGNRVGTNAAGTAAVPNGGDGVAVSPSGNTIGGTAAGAGNVVSGNSGNGIALLSSSSGTSILGNLVGTDAAGASAVPNGSNGIRVFSSANNAIGGASAGARNVVSGNTLAGISVEQNGSSGNTIAGNTIGLNAAGAAAVPNGIGVSLAAPGNTVGGLAAGAGNVISGNPEGVTITGASSNVVEGNLIGTNAAGTAGVGNGTGVHVFSAGGNTIGGTSAAARNVISGNTTGVAIEQPASTGNTVAGNFVGLDATGTSAVPNDTGLVVASGNNTIGGTTAGARNVISGNVTAGVSLQGSGASGIKVQGNWIGTNAAGTAALPNGIAIRIHDASNDTIGGTAAGARNVVSGSTRGIVVDGASSGNVVQGNTIGPDPTGTSAIGGGTGVELYASGNTVGGTAAGAGNVISGLGTGVVIGRPATQVLVQGNFIGTRADGTTLLPNTGAGVLLSETFLNQIGGVAAGAGNVIAGNGGSGVAILSGNGNAVESNSMFGNGAPGIELLPLGPIPNDDMDPDGGPNRQQNYPLLTSAVLQGPGTRVLGTLNAAPNTLFRIEIYGSPTCHPSGFGEGKTFLIKKDLTTDATGNLAIDASIGTATPGAFITATATDPNGNTSEFSPCAALGGANPGKLQFFSTTPSVSEGAGSAVITVVRTGGLTGAVSVHYATSDGTATQPGDYTQTSGDLAFADGEVAKTFAVPVVNDGAPEGTETVNLTLSAPGGGATLGAQSAATLSVLDYDAANPSVSIADASVTEGNAGTKTMTFDVTMTPHSQTVLVGWETADGTATAGSDYVAASGTLSFAPADTLKTIDVTIDGDTLPELDEVFFVNLTSVDAGTAARASAEGLIVNDEALIRGDANGNGTRDVVDVFYLINFLFAAGAPPALPCLGDVNNDGKTDVTDVFFLINFLFASGPAPAPGC